jgi:hypothetical protein
MTAAMPMAASAIAAGSGTTITNWVTWPSVTAGPPTKFADATVVTPMVTWRPVEPNGE